MAKRDHHDARREARKRERLADAAAYDALVAARPLRPPPMPAGSAQAPRLTAGARAAMKDRRLGVLDTGRAPFLDPSEGE